MALGSSLTITLDGSGGTAKVLPLINGPANGVAEYFLDDTTVTYRATVRHSEDTVKAGTQPYSRHSVTFERFTKPTEALPLGSRSQITFTIRNDTNGVQTEIVDLSEAMSFYMVKAGGIAPKLLGYEA